MQAKRAINPYYNPLKNYGEGIAYQPVVPKSRYFQPGPPSQQDSLDQLVKPNSSQQLPPSSGKSAHNAPGSRSPVMQLSKQAGYKGKRAVEQPKQQSYRAGQSRPYYDDGYQKNVQNFFMGHTPTQESIKKYSQLANKLSQKIPEKRQPNKGTIFKDPKFVDNIYKFYGAEQNVNPLGKSEVKSRGRPNSRDYQKQQIKSPVQNQYKQAPPQLPRSPPQPDKRINSLNGSSQSKKRNSPIILVPFGFPIKVLNPIIGGNSLITLPMGVNSGNINQVLGMYGVQPKNQQIWLVLQGQQRQKQLIRWVKEASAKARGLGLLGNKIQFIF